MKTVKLQAFITEKFDVRIEKHIKKCRKENPKFTRADLVRLAVMKYVTEY